MSRFQPRHLSQRTNNLEIGTSRTKYIKSKEIGAAVHSYWGASLLELCSLVERYPSQKINTLVLVAGFNDHRALTNVFIEHWKFLIQLVVLKFNPSHLVIPKTIATSNNYALNKKINTLNFALYGLINSLNLPITSPNFNRDFDHKIFSRDGIHFSRFGNYIFTHILKLFMNLSTCNPKN